MLYPVVFESDEAGGIIASAPDVPGTHDCGSDAAEAKARLAGAVLALLQSMMDDREAIPDPSPADGRAVIALPSQAWTKVLLYRALRERDWRKADLARALDTDQKTVDRLLSLSHASRPHQIDQAFAALGKVLIPTLKDAD